MQNDRTQLSTADIDAQLVTIERRLEANRRRMNQYNAIYQPKERSRASRKFDADAITSSDVPKLMLMYGDDASGLSMRISAIERALTDDGYSPYVYRSYAEASPVFDSLSLFGANPTVVIEDAIDLIKKTSSETPMKRVIEYSQMSRGDTSKLVICITSKITSEKMLEALKGYVKDAGGKVVACNKPELDATTEWLKTYVSDMGLSIPDRKVAELSSLVKDANHATSLIDQLGSAVADMSYQEMAAALKEVRSVSFREYQQAIASCDANRLMRMRLAMPQDKEGTRRFLMSCRSALNDILKMTLDTTPSLDRYASYLAKHGFYPNTSAAQRIRRSAMSHGGYLAFSRRYLSVCEMLEGVTISDKMPTTAEIVDTFVDHRSI